MIAFPNVLHNKYVNSNTSLVPSIVGRKPFWMSVLVFSGNKLSVMLQCCMELLLQQEYVLWNAIPVPLLHVTLCYDISDVIALSTFARHNDQRAMKKLFFKLLAMHTYNILAVSKLSRNVLSC